MGMINNIIPFALIVYATSRLGAGSASILNATAPIFALIVAHFATADEKITPAKIAGILLGVGGVSAMAGPQAVAGLTADLAAIGAMLVACFFYGLSAVYGRGFRGIDATVSATCQLSASALLLLPVALVIDRPWQLPFPGILAIAAVVALALVSTALAYVVYYALILRAGATNTILVTLLIPIGGVVLAWALLGETLSPGEAAGMMLIGLGLAIVDGRVLSLGATLARPRPGSSQ
jgi:drug/metabolite transporter (DMT)-like permease